MRRLLAREDGVALPIALSALAVVSLLAAMTAGGAVELSDVSTEDRNSKRALAAAEAGLNVAAYRVNRFANQAPPLADNQCVALGPTSTVGTTGECPAADGDLGNGTRYRYYATRKVLPGDPPEVRCPTQVPQAGPPPVGAGERCVTSTGEANGVVRRVQARVSNTSEPIFDFEGLVGTSGVKVNNGATITGDVGSNGAVTLGGTGSVGDVYLSSTGSLSPSPQSTYGTIHPADPFVLPKLDLEFVESLQEPLNVNDTLPGLPQALPDPNQPGYSGSVTWTAGTRDLFLGPGATITLAPGTYNFCRIKLARNAKLYVAPGGPVKIFIDSIDRDPTCPATSTSAPSVELASGTQINNPGEAKNLQLYLYGRNDGSEQITFNNGVQMRAAIYAPQSYLKFASALDVQGAVAARFLEFSASVGFTFDQALRSIVRSGIDYERSAWSECRPQPAVAGDPESGC